MDVSDVRETGMLGEEVKLDGWALGCCPSMGRIDQENGGGVCMHRRAQGTESSEFQSGRKVQDRPHKAFAAILKCLGSIPLAVGSH